MEINKIELKNEFIRKDYDSFFKHAFEIANFLIVRKYVIPKEEREDIVQDCMESLWNKLVEGKIDPERGDLMSFIWRNSSFKILDYLKKKKRREGIAYMISYDEILSDISFDEIKNDKSMKYSPDSVYEATTYSETYYYD